MAATLTTSGATLLHAGKNVSTDLSESGSTSPVRTADAMLLEFINEAEGFISAATRVDWVTKYSALDSAIKKALDEATACRAAIHSIKYDMSGYTSRAEAQTILDVNNDIVNRTISLLKDDKEKSFVEGST